MRDYPKMPQTKSTSKRKERWPIHLLRLSVLFFIFFILLSDRSFAQQIPEPAENLLEVKPKKEKKKFPLLPGWKVPSKSSVHSDEEAATPDTEGDRNVTASNVDLLQILKSESGGNIVIDGETWLKLKGGVHVKQENIEIHADEVLYNEIKEIVRIRGHVKIVIEEENGVVMVTADQASYSIRKDTVHFKNKVVCRFKDGIIYTDYLDYNRTKKEGHFLKGARILSDDNVITCQDGYYNHDSKRIELHKQVLINNPDFLLRCDTLLEDKIHILLSKEERKAQQTFLGKKKSKQLYEAKGNVSLLVKEKDITISSDRCVYCKKTDRAWITGNPILKQSLGKGDTLHILAEYFTYQKEKKKKKKKDEKEKKEDKKKKKESKKGEKGKKGKKESDKVTKKTSK